jgi:hypothetical protein
MMRTTVVLACMVLTLAVPNAFSLPDGDVAPSTTSSSPACVLVNEKDPSQPITVYNCTVAGQGSNIG